MQINTKFKSMAVVAALYAGMCSTAHAADVTNEEMMNRGFNSVIQRDYAAAITQYNQIIAADPTDAQAFYNRGTTYNLLKDYSRAIADYSQAITLNPNHARAYYNRALSYRSLGDYTRAIADYSHAIALNPTDVVYYNRGNAYKETQDYRRAISDYTKAIALNSGFVAAYSNRAISHAILGNLKEASDDARRACDFNSCKVLNYLESKRLLINPPAEVIQGF